MLCAIGKWQKMHSRLWKGSTNNPLEELSGAGRGGMDRRWSSSYTLVVAAVSCASGTGGQSNLMPFPGVTDRSCNSAADVNHLWARASPQDVVRVSQQQLGRIEEKRLRILAQHRHRRGRHGASAFGPSLTPPLGRRRPPGLRHRQHRPGPDPTRPAPPASSLVFPTNSAAQIRHRLPASSALRCAARPPARPTLRRHWQRDGAAADAIGLSRVAGRWSRVAGSALVRPIVSLFSWHPRIV